MLHLTEVVLLEITMGLLKYGAEGFERAKPQLQTRLDEFRTAAAQYLRSYAHTPALGARSAGGT